MTNMADKRTRGDRRSGRFRYVFLEKRTGFDRRRDNGTFLASLRDNDRSVALMLVGVNLLNVLDLTLTAHALRAGAEEANPVLAALFASDPVAAAVFKICVILAASALFWAFRKYKPVLQLLIAAAATFAGVIVYHGMLRLAVVA